MARSMPPSLKMHFDEERKRKSKLAFVGKMEGGMTFLARLTREDEPYWSSYGFKGKYSSGQVGRRFLARTPRLGTCK